MVFCSGMAKRKVILNLYKCIVIIKLLGQNALSRQGVEKNIFFKFVLNFTVKKYGFFKNCHLLK